MLSKGVRTKKTARVDLNLPSKFVTSCIHPCRAICQRPFEGFANSTPNQGLLKCSAIPDIKFSHRPLLHACVLKYLLVFIRTRKASRASLSIWKAPTRIEIKKQGHEVPSHFVHASPIHQLKPARNPSKKALYKKLEENSKCLETNERKETA